MLITIVKFLIKMVPESAAYAILRAAASITQKAPVSPVEREAMAQASKLFYGKNNRNVAWSWGSGPLVIFVHGWGGRAAQMAPLAKHAAALGFRSVAIDVTGHGDSPKRHTSWHYFLEDIAALSQSLHEEVYAYVGHSAGAVSMMADRNLKGIRAQRYICVSAPSFPYPPIAVIEKLLNPKKGVVERYKDYIAKQFGTTWERLQTGCSYSNAGSDLLLVYDETDRYIDHRQGDRIKSLCPGAELVKTSGYSHLDILGAPELSRAVGNFLKKEIVA